MNKIVVVEVLPPAAHTLPDGHQILLLRGRAQCGAETRYFAQEWESTNKPRQLAVSVNDVLPMAFGQFGHPVCWPRATLRMLVKACRPGAPAEAPPRGAWT